MVRTGGCVGSFGYDRTGTCHDGQRFVRLHLPTFYSDSPPVYALYNRSRNILGLFAVILLTENLVVFLSLGLTFPKRPFDPFLLVACLPDSFAWYRSVVTGTHAIFCAP
jgi:hypothetical protein